MSTWTEAGMYVLTGIYTLATELKLIFHLVILSSTCQYILPPNILTFKSNAELLD